MSVPSHLLRRQEVRHEVPHDKDIVNSSSSPRRPVLFRSYFVAVLAAALALAISAWRVHPAPVWPVLAGGCVLLVLAELAPVRLPGGGVMTAGTMADLPLLLMIGPFWTKRVARVRIAGSCRVHRFSI